MKQERSRKIMGWDASFATRADSGDLNVGIIGLGYVGLPTAIGFRDAGFNVGVWTCPSELSTPCMKGRTPLEILTWMT
ncbi:MAG: hypothetical protein Ct9H90mP16_18480 [Candidatus Poseidoniales archaeon]|nr:MAG: hypothetical protein Ct9H90mP16_18480 [Candidatus Poseidoniales archaeon]